jgi:hypothetical protein
VPPASPDSGFATLAFQADAPPEPKFATQVFDAADVHLPSRKFPVGIVVAILVVVVAAILAFILLRR